MGRGLREGNVLVEAADIAELHQKQQQRGGVLKARHDRLRREFDQAAKFEEAEQRLERPGQEHHGNIDSAVRCIEAGAEDYLAKPFNPVLLQARIGASLERKWLRDREKEAAADLAVEKERYQDLLLNILPQPIVRRIRDGEA